MQVIGFNFTKISAEHFPKFEGKSQINTNIEFLDLEEEKLSLLKDSEAVKIIFQYSITHSQVKDKDKKEDKKKDQPENMNKKGEIIIEGNIVLSATKEEMKDVQKSWKKKELPSAFKVPLFNIILRKCSSKALDLEDQINLPLHLPFPQLKAGQQSESN
jgi:hypothetical protein